MDRWAGKVAVITGASSGMGLGIAKALVQNGMIVVGLARRKTKMEVHKIIINLYTKMEVYKNHYFIE